MPSARRLATELRELRWSHVLVELLLLIVGILIALAVDGWIDDRRDARAERQYLGRLQRDLDRNLAILDEYIAFEQRQTADGIRAYRALRGAGDDDREGIAASLNHLANRRTLWLVRATYEDLLATGNLGLIRDAASRDSIVRLYQEIERTMAVIDRNNMVLVDQLYGLPLLDSGLVAPRFTTNLPGTLAESLSELQSRIDLAADPATDRVWTLSLDAPERERLANRVLRRTIVSRTSQSQVQALRVQVESVRAELAATLGR
jgi:hypothetical protein